MEPIGDPTDRIERLERVVERLEQENQAMAAQLHRAKQQAGSWLKALGFLGLATVFMILTARAVNNPGRLRTIEADRFILRDKDGNTRAALHMLPEGYPILAFYDRDGHDLLQFYAWHDNAVGMDVLDNKGNIRVGIGGDQDGGVGMAIYGGNGKKRADFGMSNSGLAGMGIYDRNGVMRIEDSVQADGSSGRTVFDHDEKPSIREGSPSGRATNGLDTDAHSDDVP